MCDCMVTGRDRAQLHLKYISLRLLISVVGYKGQKFQIPFNAPPSRDVWTVIQNPSPPAQVCQEASAG